jgi:transporter family protein
MLSASWLLLTITALVCFGVVGLLQKMSTDLVSAESSLVWLTAGSLLLEPFLFQQRAMFRYQISGMMFLLLAGMFNSLGSWAILAAMKNGGKASVVVPMTAVYPMVVCLLAPFVLHEHITFMQVAGIVCGLGAIFLLAS